MVYTFIYTVCSKTPGVIEPNKEKYAVRVQHNSEKKALKIGKKWVKQATRKKGRVISSINVVKIS